MADEVEMTPIAGAEPPKANPLGGGPAAPKVAATALKPGLKLPPKPGPAASAFRPGLKLPTQAALKPGLKLPPKPIIRKPGEAASAVQLPKPMEALKSVTQKLKGVTQEIPQQAILHKTGIIAEGGGSEAQKEAAKHKTARISLSDAMGVAPVKNNAAPMKTIRIKRPIDIPGIAPSAPAASADPATAATVAAPSAAALSATVTQRKTLKISRPAGVAVRPGGKFGIKRPGQAATVAKAAPAGDAAAPANDAVADIPELPTNVPAFSSPAQAPVDAGPAWLWTLSAVVQFAACVVIGALAWFLYTNTQTQYF